MILPSVPLMNSNVTRENRERLLEQIQSSRAHRVWIAFDRRTLFSDRAEELALLGENLRFFEAAGLEVGVWIQAFGFGEPLSYEKCSWTRIRSVTGVSREIDAFCPEDGDFLAAYLSWVEDIARLAPSMIMLDDDLCLSVRPGIGCFCPRHVELLRKRAQLPKDLREIFTGGKNSARDAWFATVGDSLRRFCRRVRETVDGVDPRIRVGLCAGYTSWDIEGTDPPELSRILAGRTKPFFRLTSAPYWVAPKVNRFPGMTLGDVIENARNQLEWCRDSDVEIFAEADTYPRPCYNVPAAPIEQFDLAMHASGVESLKYLFDYFSSPDYEQQYLRMHRRNLRFYEEIEEAFADTVPCGVRLYRPMHRICDAPLPSDFMGEKPLMRRYFSSAAALLSDHGIPSVYEGESSCAVMFGDDVYYGSWEGKRTVLDLSAARLLIERGVDVGMEEIGSAPVPAFELFEGERVRLDRFCADASFSRIILKEGAVVRSRYDTGEVASFEYGDLLVLCFDGYEVNRASSLFCSYERGRQLQSFFGRPYPAIMGAAGIYAICAEGDKRQTVLFQNHSDDPLFDFDILLPKRCASFRLVGAEGICHGDRIHVTDDLTAHGTVLLELYYEE